MTSAQVHLLRLSAQVRDDAHELARQATIVRESDPDTALVLIVASRESTREAHKLFLSAIGGKPC